MAMTEEDLLEIEVIIRRVIAEFWSSPIESTIESYKKAAREHLAARKQPSEPTPLRACTCRHPHPLQTPKGMYCGECGLPLDSLQGKCPPPSKSEMERMDLATGQHPTQVPYNLDASDNPRLKN